MNLIKFFYYMYYRPKIFLPKKTYSMYGEDIIIEQFFKNKKKVYKMINKTVGLKRFCKPEDIINVINFLASEKSNYITGADFKVDGKTS